jgi:hypothetical protein
MVVNPETAEKTTHFIYSRIDPVNGCFRLVPFTFHQVPVRWIELQAVPGPEARAWRAKIMRYTSFLGPGGPPQLRIVDCGMRIEKETPKVKSSIRNPQFNRPMHFARHALAPGHNFAFAQKRESQK